MFTFSEEFEDKIESQIIIQYNNECQYPTETNLPNDYDLNPFNEEEKIISNKDCNDSYLNDDMNYPSTKNTSKKKMMIIKKIKKLIKIIKIINLY